MRVQVSKSNALVALLLTSFKGHLRVLHNDEDSMISLYLEAALDGIGEYGDIQIMETVNEFTTLTYEVEEAALYTHFPLAPISSIVITDSLDVDVSASYEIDLRGGYVYPSIDSTHKATVTSGYTTEAAIPANIRSIVFRYGAHLYEHREAVQIGEPKHLPDWVNYALASIMRPRV